jgi:hypothetical protein
MAKGKADTGPVAKQDASAAKLDTGPYAKTNASGALKADTGPVAKQDASAVGTADTTPVAKTSLKGDSGPVGKPDASALAKADTVPIGKTTGPVTSISGSMKAQSGPAGTTTAETGGDEDGITTTAVPVGNGRISAVMVKIESGPIMKSGATRRPKLPGVASLDDDASSESAVATAPIGGSDASDSSSDLEASTLEPDADTVLASKGFIPENPFAKKPSDDEANASPFAAPPPRPPAALATATAADDVSPLLGAGATPDMWGDKAKGTNPLAKLLASPKRMAIAGGGAVLLIVILVMAFSGGSKKSAGSAAPSKDSVDKDTSKAATDDEKPTPVETGSDAVGTTDTPDGSGSGSGSGDDAANGKKTTAKTTKRTTTPVKTPTKRVATNTTTKTPVKSTSPAKTPAKTVVKTTTPNATKTTKPAVRKTQTPAKKCDPKSLFPCKK